MDGEESLVSLHSSSNYLDVAHLLVKVHSANRVGMQIGQEDEAGLIAGKRCKPPFPTTVRLLDFDLTYIHSISYHIPCLRGFYYIPSQETITEIV